MYRPMWLFLLMYGSHYMRHTGFRRLTMVNGTPGNWGVTSGESMGLGIVFNIKVLEVLTIVAPTENHKKKKKLQLKVLNPIHIPIRDCPH